ncbi:ead/Ea22-like family protein [Citrobacter freundii]|uniref:ead/Ea22-like family protein n=1 Tax=Citrobacter freundii TaxID=546 RepID=UPI00254D4821|nr:ead/Ea22-like family protein [Citrobacter freundii]
MTALNKQALREAVNAANIASWGKWESYKPHKGARGYEVKVGAKAVAQHCLKVDSAFIAAANPATVLALLDELEAKDKSIGFLKDQLAQLANFNPDWDRLEAAIDSLREHMAKLSAAEKRIAELEALTVNLPKRSVGEVMHMSGFSRDYAEGWCSGNDNAIHEIRAAGISVKER